MLYVLRLPLFNVPVSTPAGNLLLNRSLLCKVGDVGLSRLMPGARGRTAGGSPMAGVSTIMDSRLVGTPCYMDPEYLRTGRFGPKSDVYSLGECACAGEQTSASCMVVLLQLRSSQCRGTAADSGSTCALQHCALLSFSAPGTCCAVLLCAVHRCDPAADADRARGVQGCGCG